MPDLRSGRAVITSLPGQLALLSHRTGAARRALDAFADGLEVDFQLRQCAAEGVAVHAQLARGAALVAFVLRQYGQDEALLKFAHGLGVKNFAVMHLQDEGFELVFHWGYLSFDVMLLVIRVG